jgi:pyruvate dehydrogenase E2 component (dihydrolipoamide acetyltransferase)
MSIAVTMPRQGQSVETCIITKWFKQKGDPVKAGDILFSYETDKAAFDMEAPVDGTLLEIFFGEGSEVPVLVNVAVLGSVGEDISSLVPGTPGSAEAKETVQVKPEDNVPPAGIRSGESGTGVYSKTRISPKAKRLAREAGMNFTGIAGSGPYGRITGADIEKLLSGESLKAAAVRSPVDEFTEKPLSNVRRLIAKAMHSSLQNSAQLTHHMSADVRKLLEARRKIKEGLAKGTEKQDITLNDMVCWCVIRTLLKFPEANTHFLDDRIKTFNRVHLGIAVDTPRGLMVPVIRNADEMNLVKLSQELKSVAESCKKGNVNPELLQSTAASFTVSNLGNYGVEMFTPVINLPQAAILGVCTIISRPADLGNNIFGFVPYMGLSLTYDHRAIDGGPATLFLKEIKEQIERFSL